MQHTRNPTAFSYTAGGVLPLTGPRNILVHHQLVVIAKFPSVELITAFYYINKRHSFISLVVVAIAKFEFRPSSQLASIKILFPN